MCFCNGDTRELISMHLISVVTKLRISATKLKTLTTLLQNKIKYWVSGFGSQKVNYGTLCICAT